MNSLFNNSSLVDFSTMSSSVHYNPNINMEGPTPYRGEPHQGKLLGATLIDVIKLAGLIEAYAECTSYTLEATKAFSAGDYEQACRQIHKIWMSPHCIPALLLTQCYDARSLIYPSWYKPGKLYPQELVKKTGGTRTILVPDKRVRICMGAINSILQTSCQSWSPGTTGFRPGSGTHKAVTLLTERVNATIKSHGQVYILSFDIQKAFNSVKVDHLFRTLKLKYLHNDIKALIWQWQHMPVHGDKNLITGPVLMNGLAQGFSYSPTLFAWYLDNLLVRDSTLIGYADNFVGVYGTIDEAENALLQAIQRLAHSNLIISTSSINYFKFTAESTPRIYPWLGHGVSLPDCSFIMKVNQQKAPVSAEVVITLEMWQSMFNTTNWVQKVLNSNWRKRT